MSHFCHLCGKAMEIKSIENRPREVCPSCGWTYYEQHKVSAGVRIQQENRLLFVQRGIEPWYGLWYLPAGFVEADEEPEQAAIRETFEETGLLVEITGIAGIYTFFDDPRGNGVVLLYDAKIIGGSIRTSNESLKVGFFSPEEIKKMTFAGACVTKEVEDWLKLNE